MSDQPQPAPQQPQTVVNVNMANTNTAVAEAKAVAAAKAAPKEWVPPKPVRSEKSIVLAYIYFVLAGYLGWHRFYLSRPRGVWLLLFWGSLAVSASVDILLLLAPASLLALDFFSIPRWVRRYDPQLALVRTPRGTVRRPPSLRGLGWRKVEEGPQQPPTVAPSAGAVSQAEPPRTDTPPGSKPKQELRTRLLHEAHRGDGKLTVTQAVMASGEDWDSVERCLRDMVQAGYVDVDNEPESGVIVYVFPELVGRPGSSDPEISDRV